MGRPVEILREHGIDCAAGPAFYLTILLHKQDHEENIDRFADWLVDKGLDCLLIDRVCIGAQPGRGTGRYTLGDRGYRWQALGLC